MRSFFPVSLFLVSLHGLGTVGPLTPRMKTFPVLFHAWRQVFPFWLSCVLSTCPGFFSVSLSLAALVRLCPYSYRFPSSSLAVVCPIMPSNYTTNFNCACGGAFLPCAGCRLAAGRLSFTTARHVWPGLFIRQFGPCPAVTPCS